VNHFQHLVQWFKFSARQLANNGETLSGLSADEAEVGFQ
jgi:hypothetical protein